VQQHWKREGLRLIRQHPLLFVKSQIFGLFKLLLGTGEQSFVTAMGLTEPGGPLRDVFRLPFAAYWQRWARPHPWLVLLFFLTGIHLFALYICLSVGLWRLFRTGGRQCRPAHLVLGCLICYLLAVSAGPEAYSRFRVPLMPFLALYGGYGLACVLSREA
jgi:hypothetical protein